MINPLYLPELREMLQEQNVTEMEEFCEALHPARTADFMQGLTASEAWQILSHTNLDRKTEIFAFLDLMTQVEIVDGQDRKEIAELISAMAPDDRVDLLNDVEPEVVSELMPLLPREERRDILHLRSYAEGTAGAVMTTDVAMLTEDLTVREALDRVQQLAQELETIYYLYIIDEIGHLRGLVSARQLLSALRQPQTKLSELMQTGLVTVEVDDDQEEVAQKVARYDLLAIPVVDVERKLRGIITYDDIFDVVQEEALEDAHRSAAVEPLQNSYLQTSVLTLVWKRGVWLIVLFFAALLTAFALKWYEADLMRWGWLMFFVPLIISSGGNSGNQSATLVITGLRTNDIRISDWARVLKREIFVGLMLGIFLGACGLIGAWTVSVESRTASAMWVLPLTIVFVVISGSLVGSMLPLMFEKLGLDPALMSNPCVAGIVDIIGIVVYMNVAWTLLG
jgi:magnesium transporter